MLLAQVDPLSGLTQFGVLGFLALASIIATRTLWQALQTKEAECRAERDAARAAFVDERNADRAAYMAVLQELRDSIRDIAKKIGA